jgi:phage protein D
MSDSRDCAACEIKIDGVVAAGTVDGPNGQPGTGILRSVQVDQRIDCPDMFSFDVILVDENRQDVWKSFKEGAKVEISLGWKTPLTTVIKGEVHYLEPVFRSGGSFLTVGGYDVAHRLTRGTRSRTWGDGIEESGAFKSAVNDTISKAGSQVQKGGTSDSLATDEVKEGKGQKKYVAQLNAPDYLFMKWLGYDADKKVDAASSADQKISFKDIDVTGNAVKTLVRETKDASETPVMEARFTLSTVRQVARVEVRGWDPKNKKAIVGKADASDFSFGGTAGSKLTGVALYASDSEGKVLTIVDRPVEDQEEADAVAKAIFNQVSLEFLTAEVELKGEPTIGAGMVVEMKEFADRIDGKFVVMQATHRWNSTSGLTTHLKLARNDAGDPP